jgi:hypothetical protein
MCVSIPFPRIDVGVPLTASLQTDTPILLVESDDINTIIQPAHRMRLIAISYLIAF